MNVGTMYNAEPATFRLGIYRGTFLLGKTSLMNIGPVTISRTNNF